MESLRADPAGMRQVAGRIEALGGVLRRADARSALASDASWQSSVAIANSAQAGSVADETVLVDRIRATTQKITVAANMYTNTDAGAASSLAGRVV